MELMHNEVIRIAAGELKGIYRVVLDEPTIESVVVVRLDADAQVERRTVGRKKNEKTKRPRKKAPAPLVGELLWLSRRELEALNREHNLLRAEIDLDPFFYLPVSAVDKDIFETRKAVMKDFLNFLNLRDSILGHHGLGSLVKAAVESAQASRAQVYKLWSLLCRNGFTEVSLKPMRERCGAAGVARPCDPGGRQKAGRKTNAQRMAARTGIKPPPTQPGMSTDWRNRILAADLTIPEPKPNFPARYTMILNSHFVNRFKVEDGKLIAVEPLDVAAVAKHKKKGGVVVEVDPNQGEYPTREQVRRVLEKELPRLVRLAQRTTAGHFKRNLRGLVARNWKGVGGPGHTWAIDSTIGDIYLRSSVDAAWIIGRPVVYVMCDVWSTAVVGFYVCLQGPSWDMAKLALFSAGTDPELIGELWGYHALQTLSPAPTLPALLLCDRGEYLSRAASQTGITLTLGLSYTPPYRPDLKGVVEVLHRIMKDHQRCHFIPGAIDMRRKELELRKFNPMDPVFTTRQFVHYLYTMFTTYNLTADRQHRLDAHMKAAGVFPSPAGLWAWGHRMGIGTSRAIPQAEIITSLLLSDTASVTRKGVMYAGREYRSSVIDEEQWTAYARNFGSWSIPCNHYPGSVSRIWTPNIAGNGFMDLRLSEQSTASPELTFDEVADSFAFDQLRRADVTHANAMERLKAMRKVQELVEIAKAQTAAAISRDRGIKPTISEARKIEGMHLPFGNPAGAAAAEQPNADEADQNYLDMMRAIAAAASEEQQHGQAQPS
jgi:putative transposase